MSFKAWYIPEEAGVRLSGSPMKRGYKEILIPEITPKKLGKIVSFLKEMRNKLSGVPVLEIAKKIDSAVQRWQNGNSLYRKNAIDLMSAVEGWSPQMVDKGLTIMLENLRYPHFVTLLKKNLGDPLCLDTFKEYGGCLKRAYGPEFAAHIFSGNIPGLPALTIVSTLLVKSPFIGKSASGEPVFPVLFAQSLAESDTLLGNSFAVLYWTGGRSELEAVLYDEADIVTATGSDEAVEEIKSNVKGKFLGFGHKVSFGVVARELTGNKTIPALAAYDTALFDQQGCLSPHVFYVERGGVTSPHSFAGNLAGELDKLEKSLPRGRISHSEAAAIRQVRGEIMFKKLSGQGTDIWQSDSGTAWTVIYEENPAFVFSCLNRTVRIKPVVDISEVPEQVKHYRRYLQSAGTAIPENRLKKFAEQLGELGVTRICPIGLMQYPPIDWHNQGFDPFGGLIRWVDWETHKNENIKG